MAENLSAEQVQEKHLRDLGPELGPLYHALYNEVAWLHAKWLQYRQLYGHSPERIQLLNSVAGHLVRIIQDALWEDILLSLARLTDPPETGRKANLTLQRLSPAIVDNRLANDIAGLVGVVLKNVEFARDWRNRHLAHRDLALALDKGAEPLQGGSRASVEAVLVAVRAVMNRIESHYWNSETAYLHFIANGRDGESLLYYLRAGVEAEQRRMERLRQGNPLPEDLERDDEA